MRVSLLCQRLIIITTLYFCGCGISFRRPWTPANSFESVDCPYIETNNRAALYDALSGAEEHLRTVPEERQFTIADREISRNGLLSSLTELKSLVDYETEQFNQQISQRYQCYRPRSDSTLITGYYEPVLHGSLKKHPPFIYPVYRNPKSVGESAEYTREDIDFNGVLNGLGLEILWVDDPLALFFLHIQGSGAVRLSDGRVLQIGYDGTNGYPYRAIGKYLLEKEILPKEHISMQTIKAFLNERPDLMQEVLSSNPSYVFFKEKPGGPFGNIGVKLIPWVSVATDSSLVPPGAPLFLTTKTPRGEFSSIVVNLDTGGAIKGPGRIDLYMGDDGEAAGRMKEVGEYYLLIRRDAA